MNKKEELEKIRIRLTHIYMGLGNPSYVGADRILNLDINLLEKNNAFVEEKE